MGMNLHAFQAGVFRFLLRTLTGLLIVVFLYVAAALVLSFLGAGGKQTHCEERREVFLSSNGIHLDLVFPREYLPEGFVERLETPPAVRYLAFGWGDLEFYLQTPTWEDLRARVVFGSLFLRGQAALHLTYRYRQWDSWVPLYLCPHQFQRLVHYVEATFEQDARSQLREVAGAGYTAHDRFFKARGNFSPIHTCNQWVNRGLKQAGVRSSVWSPFVYGVLYHVRMQPSTG